MAKDIDKLGIDLDGVGHTLSDNKLMVPIYQRSYAWEDAHVTDLFTDIFSAIGNSETEYFVGSIVISSNKTRFEVIDGQQRLATCSIFIAAIRDYFIEKGDENRANDLQNKYLSSRDIRSQEIIPNLTLNNSDHDFYYKEVILPKIPGQTPEHPSKESHRRITAAYSKAKRSVSNYASLSNNPSTLLLDLIDFINDNLKVIVVKVPSHANAYTIFETLNDRGLDLAISDLLKNLLLGQSEDRITEVQSYWTAMYSVLEATENETLVITFFRQYWSSINGITREKELYQKIKEKITSKQKAIDTSKNLAAAAKVYVSLIDTSQTFWDDYSPESKTLMQRLNMFGMVQVRPLLLSIISNFNKNETEKALRFLVSVSVRFLIFGGGGGGVLEALYSERAKEISNKEITTSDELIEKMKGNVPTDVQFLEAFKSANVSKQVLARYYLLELEKFARGQSQQELIPNADEKLVNLEHILPRNPDPSAWSIDGDTHKALVNRLGNLAILSSKLNSDVGNSGFQEKKTFYNNSEFILTKEIATNDFWNQESISTRQTRLAELAVKVWQLK